MIQADRINYSHVSAAACMDLWSAVIHGHLLTALRPDGTKRLCKSERGYSDWFVRHSTDFLNICSMIGVNGPAVRERYIAGKITFEMVEKSKRNSEVERDRRRVGAKV